MPELLDKDTINGILSTIAARIADETEAQELRDHIEALEDELGLERSKVEDLLIRLETEMRANDEAREKLQEREERLKTALRAVHRSAIPQTRRVIGQEDLITNDGVIPEGVMQHVYAILEEVDRWT